ncbi:hypothetical protein CLV37_109182 [Kineococcus rhizosphaerae]|uniref:Uncharacterized protein n=1 Tax=Kineococcus rhizosphaerae TaxID=559628 RepID=A0A2T0R0Z6_9ACTN|nr:hypothetical protein CLV37_109182 [Kineococcus rhizosphaerae]
MVREPEARGWRPPASYGVRDGVRDAGGAGAGCGEDCPYCRGPETD